MDNKSYVATTIKLDKRTEIRYQEIIGDTSIDKVRFARHCPMIMEDNDAYKYINSFMLFNTKDNNLNEEDIVFILALPLYKESSNNKNERLYIEFSKSNLYNIREILYGILNTVDAFQYKNRNEKWIK